MKIEIWSDVVCPWCYIGKRRLEEALEAFPHRDEVDVVWRSYQLDPSTPRDARGTVAEHLGVKYGVGTAGALKMMEQVQQVAAEVGLDYSRLPEGMRANTIDAHRLLHSAGEKRGDLKEALLKAYFVDVEDVADHDVLARVADGVGLDPAETRRVLATPDAHLDEVEADIDQAVQYGAGGVPFFVIDQKFGISGAQPGEVFARALQQAWDARPKPALVDLGSADGAACEGDSCAI